MGTQLQGFNKEAARSDLIFKTITLETAWRMDERGAGMDGEPGKYSLPLTVNQKEQERIKEKGDDRRKGRM